MKKILSVILVLSFLLFAFAVPASAEDEPENGSGLQSGNSLKVVQPGGGAYVIIGKLKPGELEFKYGWNNCAAFEDPAVGYWIAIYDVTASHGVWGIEVPLEECPKMLKLDYSDIEFEDDPVYVSGHEYCINFFVRCDKSTNPYINTTTVQVFFIAP